MKVLRAALAAAGVLFCVGSVASAGDILTATELRSLAPGRYSVDLLGTISMVVTLNANGTVLGSARGQRDTGRWALSGSKLCIGWNRWMGGQTRCSSLSSEPGYYQGRGFTFRRI